MKIGLLLIIIAVILLLFRFRYIYDKSFYQKLLYFAVNKCITENYFANVMDSLIIEFKDLLIEKFSVDKNISNSDLSKIIFDNIKDTQIFSLPIEVDNSMQGQIIEEQIQEILDKSIIK